MGFSCYSECGVTQPAASVTLLPSLPHPAPSNLVTSQLHCLMTLPRVARPYSPLLVTCFRFLLFPSSQAFCCNETEQNQNLSNHTKALPTANTQPGTQHNSTRSWAQGLPAASTQKDVKKRKCGLRQQMLHLTNSRKEKKNGIQSIPCLLSMSTIN